MGAGDDIIATGLARGLKERGYRAAFGDGHKIIWGPFSEAMFRNNPNIAPPGSEQSNDLLWVDHYKGKRKYNKLVNGTWRWNYDFKVTPGQFFFSDGEKRSAEYLRSSMNGYVVVEPNVEWHKSVAVNKDWGEDKYSELTKRLQNYGIHIVQFIHKNSKRRLRGATTIECHSFREAIAMLSLSRLYIGPEGGMHHAAAAVGLKGVVIMGGFIPPAVVGYDGHINLTGGATACGSIQPCTHCKEAMANISVDQVRDAAMRQLT